MLIRGRGLLFGAVIIYCRYFRVTDKYIYIYIYIYTERERERERDRQTDRQTDRVNILNKKYYATQRNLDFPC